MRRPSDFNLVECFDADSNSCRIVGSCKLKNVLSDAMSAYLAVLDGSTLADLIAPANRKPEVQAVSCPFRPGQVRAPCGPWRGRDAAGTGLLKAACPACPRPAACRLQPAASSMAGASWRCSDTTSPIMISVGGLTPADCAS